jgi:hypothetical protein
VRRARAPRIAKLSAIVVLAWFLAGCIRPVEVTPTETPGGAIGNPLGTPSISFTPAPSLTSVTPADVIAIQAFIQNIIGRPVATGTLAASRVIQLVNESVVSFSFNNPSGLPCIGAVMASRDSFGTLNIFNGEARCATELGATAIAGSWLFVSATTGDILIVTVAQVIGAAEPPLLGMVTYEDGNQLQVTLEENWLVNIRVGVYLATRIQFIGQSNTVVADILITQ